MKKNPWYKFDVNKLSQDSQWAKFRLAPMNEIDTELLPLLNKILEILKKGKPSLYGVSISANMVQLNEKWEHE